MTVSGTLTCNFVFNQVPSTGFLTGQALNVPETLAVKLGNGAGVDSINLLAITKLALVTPTPQTLDLTSLLDVQGNAVNLAKVRLMILKNYSQVDGDVVTVGAAAGGTEWDGWLSSLGTITVPSATAANPHGGFVIVSCPGVTGLAVSGGSKILKLDPGAASKSVDVILMGA